MFRVDQISVLFNELENYVLITKLPNMLTSQLGLAIAKSSIYLFDLFLLSQAQV